MEKITPHLWYDREEREAAALYTFAFPDSRIKSAVTLEGTPSGFADVVTIELFGHELTLISVGPLQVHSSDLIPGLVAGRSRRSIACGARRRREERR
jgi:predicted 3-demethylubiquinone-9 3-methyltransferase (glyoxalase superfamily)